MMLVEVQDVVVTNVGIAVLLTTPDDPRALPIFIGPAEAQAITVRLNEVEFERPMTHDLTASILAELNVTVESVHITSVTDGTFFAELNLRQLDDEYTIDSRPSDAIAIALRTDSPIFVNEEVFNTAAQSLPTRDDEPESHSAEKTTDPLKILRRKLKQAIADERYEDAAQLRDRIAELTDEPSAEE